MHSFAYHTNRDHASPIDSFYIFTCVCEICQASLIILYKKNTCQQHFSARAIMEHIFFIMSSVMLQFIILSGLILTSSFAIQRNQDDRAASKRGRYLGWFFPRFCVSIIFKMHKTYHKQTRACQSHHPNSR